MNADIEQGPRVNTKQTDSPKVNDWDFIPIEMNHIESIVIDDISTPQHFENEDKEIDI